METKDIMGSFKFASTEKVTLEQIQAYVNEIEVAIKKDYDEHYPNLEYPTFEIQSGPKYNKIVIKNPYASVHCFVDNFGNIYKAAGWKAPAKGIRGHILAEKKPLRGYEFYVRL